MPPDSLRLKFKQYRGRDSGCFALRPLKAATAPKTGGAIPKTGRLCLTGATALPGGQRA